MSRSSGGDAPAPIPAPLSSPATGAARPAPARNGSRTRRRGGAAPGRHGPDRLSDALRAWVAQRALVVTFVKSDLKNRYGAAALGFGWSVVEPLLLIAIYALLFSVILEVKFPGAKGTGGFVVYLMCALLPWLAVSESIGSCVDCLRGNANLLKNVYFAPGILPIATVAANLIVEAVALTLFILILALIGRPPSLALLALPVTLVLQAPLILGICWTVSCLNLFYRDVKHFVSLALLLWMFVTPIFYPSSLLATRFDWVLRLNPLAFIVDVNRRILLEGALPPFRGLAIVSATSLAVCLAGARLFVRRQHLFADLV